MKGSLDRTYGDGKAITITFDPKEFKALNSDPPAKQLKRVSGVFDLLHKAVNFELYPELTENGVIHLHGIIWYRDYIKWSRSIQPRIRRAYGHILLKKNINDKWFEYCRKEWPTNMIIFGIDGPLTNKSTRDLNINRYVKKIVKISDDRPIFTIQELLMEYRNDEHDEVVEDVTKTL